MPAQYIVRATTEFSAAHVLYGYAGACNRVHGHNFKVELEVEARAVDDIGMAIDFTMLESIAASIAQELDHRLLNEIPPFNEVNPTAENLGAYFWTRASRALADKIGTGATPDVEAAQTVEAARGVRLRAVTVRENDRTSVTYSELPDGA
ncbi:MAG: 6-carboxytetrahydropterin synthase QueD [Nannocystales bacterium]